MALAQNLTRAIGISSYKSKNIAALLTGARVVPARPAQDPFSIHKGTRVLISLWDSLMFGRVPGKPPARTFKIHQTALDCAPR